mmetsp:Transcript_82618/g.164815  ORF Transcript_82618/g.164815 Transcript_82618/m.164815 type:complete len:231 (+) Transcript_82618:3055-3747(+)
MVELHGSVGELHHALTEPCKALNVDVTLGPLDLAYTEFQRVVQRAIFRIGSVESEVAQVGPLVAAADEFERAAQRAEDKNTHKEGKMRASVSEARRLVKLLRTAVEHVREHRQPAPAPLLDSPAGAAGAGEDDVVLPARPDLRDVFVRGMHVRDAVLGRGTVVEVGDAGGEHGGMVKVSYDDKRPSHGQPTPLWRTATGGLLEPLHHQMDGIRVVEVTEEDAEDAERDDV